MFDDGQSKATETTEDSSIEPSLALALAPQDSLAAPQEVAMKSRRRHQTWRSGSRSVPEFSPQWSHQPSRHDSVESSSVPFLIRRDSDPCSPEARRQSAPVKCPPSKNKMVTNAPFAATSPPEGEDTQYLMRMYDTRTWEMYRRITDARKNSQFSYTSKCYANAQLDPSTIGESTPEWENLQHDCMATEGGHDMVFLFDFD